MRLSTIVFLEKKHKFQPKTKNQTSRNKMLDIPPRLRMKTDHIAVAVY
jgi:hypothetical protein